MPNGEQLFQCLRQGIEAFLARPKVAGGHDSEEEFLDKAFFLNRFIFDRLYDPYHALHSAVLMVSQILRHDALNDRMSYADTVQSEVEQAEFREDIEMLVQRHTSESWVAAFGNCPTYYNLASACRQLRESYMDSLCETPDTADDTGFRACFHTDSMKTLELLQEEAQKEVRMCVATAVEGRLPQELAELICEFALKAEGVPLDWRTRGSGIEATETMYRPAYACNNVKAYYKLAD